LNLVFYTWINVEPSLVFSPGFGLDGFTNDKILSGPSVHASCSICIFELDRAGYRHGCTLALQSAPESMSFLDTLSFLFLYAVLECVSVGFYDSSNPKALK